MPKFLLLIIVLIFVSCGGGGSGSSSSGDSGSDKNTINGKIVDGYIKDATVCIDENDNYQCDLNELQTKSDNNGYFTLDIKDIQNTNYKIIAVGGIDTSTNKKLTTILSKKITDQKTNINITPLTTLEESYISLNNRDDFYSKYNISKDLLDKDPMKDKEAFKENQKIIQSIALIKGITKYNKSNLSHKEIMDTFARSINEKSKIDLDMISKNLLDTNVTISDKLNKFIELVDKKSQEVSDIKSLSKVQNKFDNSREIILGLVEIQDDWNSTTVISQLDKELDDLNKTDLKEVENTQVDPNLYYTFKGNVYGADSFLYDVSVCYRYDITKQCYEQKYHTIADAVGNYSLKILKSDIDLTKDRLYVYARYKNNPSQKVYIYNKQISDLNLIASELNSDIELNFNYIENDSYCLNENSHTNKICKERNEKYYLSNKFRAYDENGIDNLYNVVKKYKPNNSVVEVILSDEFKKLNKITNYGKFVENIFPDLEILLSNDIKDIKKEKANSIRFTNDFLIIDNRYNEYKSVITYIYKENGTLLYTATKDDILLIPYNNEGLNPISDDIYAKTLAFTYDNNLVILSDNTYARRCIGKSCRNYNIYYTAYKATNVEATRQKKGLVEVCFNTVDFDGISNYNFALGIDDGYTNRLLKRVPIEKLNIKNGKYCFEPLHITTTKPVKFYVQSIDTKPNDMFKIEKSDSLKVFGYSQISDDDRSKTNMILEVSKIENDQFLLKWNPIINTDFYKIQISDNKEMKDPYTLYNTAINETFFVLPFVQLQDQYYLKIEAINENNETISNSNIVKIIPNKRKTLDIPTTYFDYKGIKIPKIGPKDIVYKVKDYNYENVPALSHIKVAIKDIYNTHIPFLYASYDFNQNSDGTWDYSSRHYDYKIYDIDTVDTHYVVLGRYVEYKRSTDGIFSPSGNYITSEFVFYLPKKYNGSTLIDEDQDGQADNPDDLNDTDKDGVIDGVDQCKNSIFTSRSQIGNDGCSAEDKIDTDGDGIADGRDICIYSKFQSINDIDQYGCASYEYTDKDNDGVIDSQDWCPDPYATSYIANDYTANHGCSPVQWNEYNNDNDNDNVINGIDKCKNTPSIYANDVNNDGCAPEELRDSDNDGINDAYDKCVNTPTIYKNEIDTNGCYFKEILDSDNDGIKDINDLCPLNTFTNKQIDVNGCNEDQLDDDNDGVINRYDMCNNTLLGVSVNKLGCEVKSISSTISIQNLQCNDNGTVTWDKLSNYSGYEIEKSYSVMDGYYKFKTIKTKVGTLDIDQNNINIYDYRDITVYVRPYSKIGSSISYGASRSCSMARKQYEPKPIIVPTPIPKEEKTAIIDTNKQDTMPIISSDDWEVGECIKIVEKKYGESCGTSDSLDVIYKNICDFPIAIKISFNLPNSEKWNEFANLKVEPGEVSEYGFWTCHVENNEFDMWARRADDYTHNLPTNNK